MKEFVGYCSTCKKEIHCLDGFINGVITKKKDTLLCFECADNNEKNALASQTSSDTYDE